jgi:hypothetical protein
MEGDTLRKFGLIMLPMQHIEIPTQLLVHLKVRFTRRMTVNYNVEL